jgi:DNA-binding transcriptional LysR family regulator
VHAGNVRRVVCAAPEFLHRYGAPQHPDQLTAYRVVAASAVTQTAEWRFVEARATVSVRIRARLSVTSNKAAIVAAGRGWGLTRVLSYQIAPQLASGALVIVLEDYEPAPLPIHVVYQHGRNLPARVRSFVDFCVARLRADPALKAAESG